MPTTICNPLQYCFTFEKWVAYISNHGRRDGERDNPGRPRGAERHAGDTAGRCLGHGHKRIRVVEILVVPEVVAQVVELHRLRHKGTDVQ